MEEKKFRFGQVREITEDQKKDRIAEFVISDETKDRQGTVLNMSNWNLDRFNANGIVGYQHNVYGGGFCNAPNPDDVIGKGEAFIEGDKLIGRVMFEPEGTNELADKIWQKVLFGSLKATSVGFLPIGEGKFGEGSEARGKEDETFYFEGQELLEFSIVNIPANVNALKRTVREQTHGALLYIKEQLGNDYSFSDIEGMKIKDVLNILENDGKEQKEIEKVEDNLKFYHDSLERDIEIKRKKADMAVC